MSSVISTKVNHDNLIAPLELSQAPRLFTRTAGKASLEQKRLPSSQDGTSGGNNCDRCLTISDTSLRKNARHGSTSQANSSRTRRHSFAVRVNFVGPLAADGSAVAAAASSPAPPGAPFSEAERSFSWWLGLYLRTAQDGNRRGGSGNRCRIYQAKKHGLCESKVVSITGTSRSSCWLPRPKLLEDPVAVLKGCKQ